jgi:outer membrane protein OmpA-like peptidoglycan-associated protein
MTVFRQKPLQSWLLAMSASLMWTLLAGIGVCCAQNAPKPKVDYEAWFNSTIKDGYFNTGGTGIRPDAREILSSDAEALKQHPNVKFVVQGQCDERGSDAVNNRLARRRAASAKNFLLEHGVSAEQLTATGIGKRDPVCTDHDEQCWQKNRRAHLVFASAEE